MKLKNFLVLLIGLIISVIGWMGWFSKDGLTNGMITLYIGYPLILIGLIVLIYKAVKNRKSGMVP